MNLYHLFVAIILACGSFSSYVFAEPSLKLSLSPQSDYNRSLKRGFDFEDLFEQSDLFEEESFFISTHYQTWSTMGSRPDRSGTLIPPINLQGELRIIHNLGLRVGASLHVWEEEKVLARSFSQEFRETFQYRYWTLSAGLAWHFTIDDRWDPYLGGDINFRRGRGFCSCVDLRGNKLSIDLFAGTRYFLSDRFYLQAEFGSSGVGNISTGLGLKFNRG